MTGASRLLAAIALLSAGPLALGACGSADSPPEQSAVGEVTTTTSSQPPDESGDSSVRASDPASVETGADEQADRLCPDDPRAGGDTEVVINRGEMACPEVTSLLDEYYGLAQSGQFGNAGVVPDVDGFSCVSPTARSAAVGGFHTRCASPAVEILVRPAEPRIPGEQQEVSRFIPDGSLINDRSFFDLPGGGSSCAIFPDHTPPKAVCYGPMPAGLAQVPGLDGNPAPANAVQVEEQGAARPVHVGTRPYPTDGVPFTTLEVGQTLASSGFACTVTAPDAVTCTNVSGAGFDYSPAQIHIH